MFWGLIMEPQRRYTQQVKKSFHITMAALDISTSSEEPAQVMCGFEGRNYLLCTLKKPDLLQCPLDLSFNTGSEVSFAANGKCHVHLTGYLVEEDLTDPDEPEAEEEEEELEEEQEIVEKSKKRTKKVLENGPPTKKLKNTKVTSSQNKSQNSDSDESDYDIKTLLEKSLVDSDDDSDAVIDEDVEEEESEDDEVLENDDDDSSLSEGDSDEEEEKVSSLKMNGVPKKQEQENRKQKKNKKEKQIGQDKKFPKSEQKEVKTPNKENQASRKKVIQGGVIVEDIKEGQGVPAKNGKIVNVYYEGRLKQNNKVFDSTNKGAGFTFRLGAGDVIKGWDVGVLGMKPGGKRRIICPASMAYGQKGSPPAIPPNSTLVFEVELRKCH